MLSIISAQWLSPVRLWGATVTAETRRTTAARPPQIFRKCESELAAKMLCRAPTDACLR